MKYLRLSCIGIGLVGCLIAGSNLAQASDPKTTVSVRDGETSSVRIQTGNAYQSAWAEMFPETLAKNSPRANSLIGMRSQSRILSDFYAAAESSNLQLAELRWKGFLRKYVLPGGEYEDGTAAQLCSWSQAELERCQSLSEGQGRNLSSIERKIQAIAKKLGAK
tara:strand:- start:3072 stop:3563 length:492 start_codon:yes stop_codon:yes gene_type:complete